MSVQLKLTFVEIFTPVQPLWEQLDPQAQQIFVEVMARLIARAVSPEERSQKSEEENDD